MRGAAARTILYLSARLTAAPPVSQARHRTPAHEAGTGMERTDWLDEGLNPVAAAS
jgi:hypothetical protein